MRLPELGSHILLRGQDSLMREPACGSSMLRTNRAWLATMQATATAIAWLTSFLLRNFFPTPQSQAVSKPLRRPSSAKPNPQACQDPAIRQAAFAACESKLAFRRARGLILVHQMALLPLLSCAHWKQRLTAFWEVHLTPAKTTLMAATEQGSTEARRATSHQNCVRSCRLS